MMPFVDAYRVARSRIVQMLVSSVIAMIASPGLADVRLPPVFADHMVLQRDQPLPVWGSATPGEEVTVSFGASTRRTTANKSGAWRVTLPAQSASGDSQRLVVSGRNTLNFNDVLVGEVWLCAGQSNMEWPLAQVDDAKREIAGANHPNLRLLYLRGAARGGSGVYTSAHVERLAADKFCHGQWKVCSPETAQDFSAVAYFFGERLQRELDVPIGLICPAIGGVPIEAWIRRRAMSAHPQLHRLVRGNWLTNANLEPWCRQRAASNLERAFQAKEDVPGDDLGPNHSFKPGFMWDAGIAPLIPFAMRGAIWYQGESNAESPQQVAQHQELVPLLVRDWRSQWQQGEFPFVFVQLPGMNRPDWPAFRNSQRRMAGALPNTGMAVTIDLGAANNVHPGDKRPVGERLAQWALAKVYDQSGVAASGPLVSHVSFEPDHTVVIHFNHVDTGLTTTDGRPPRHFETAGSDGTFHPATARANQNTLRLEPQHDGRVEQVRYAWQPFPNPAVNLANAQALPASPFLVRRQSLMWEQLPELPDTFGFGGPLVGTHNGALIVAGGANFPLGPPWPAGDQPAGAKVWHDRIFVLIPGEQRWREAGNLPQPLAYAPVVSHASGMYVLGGESFDDSRKNHDIASVLRLTWDTAKKQVQIEDEALPPLPLASSYHSGAIIGDVIYVAASHTQGEESRRLDTKALWSLDLSQPKDRRKWKALPAWPGKPRFKMAMATAQFAEKDSSPREHLFLISGGTWVKNETGEIDLSKFEYFEDAFRCDPATTKWTQLASLPKLKEKREVVSAGYRYDEAAHSWLPVNEKDSVSDVNALFDDKPRAAAAAVAISDEHGRVLLFSGSTGRYVTMNVKDRPLFPAEVLGYDVQANRWSVAGQMPSAVVTTGITQWEGRIVIASGEIRPGVRTREVQSLTIDQVTP